MSSTMQAARVKQFGQAPMVKELPQPTPGPGQILVKTKTCGVCNTDLRLARATDG